MATRKQRIMPSSAAEAVANIEELLTQILGSLPTRSLARFKCVSTHWLSLISDLDTLKNPKISAIFSCEIQDESFKSIPLGQHEIQPGWNPFKTLNNSILDGSRLRILQSCNGLFLCSNICRFQGPRSNHLVYVVNPTTSQFRVVPSPRNLKRKHMHGYDFVPVRYALAFDPSKSPHYEVVCVTNSVISYFLDVERKGEHHKIDIYSSETGKWRHLKIPFFQSPSDEDQHYDCKKMAMHFDERSSESAVYCNGAVHWIRHDYEVSFGFAGDYEFLRDESDVMHYFDLGEKRLGLVSSTPPVPLVVNSMPFDDSGLPNKWPKLAQRCFGQSGGRLYLIETFEHCITQFDVMEMEKDYSGWFVKYHVDVNQVFPAPPDSNALVILWLTSEEEKDAREEDSSYNIWLHIPGKVMSYDLKNKELKMSTELEDKELFLNSENFRLHYRRYDNHPYMETLACV